MKHRALVYPLIFVMSPVVFLASANSNEVTVGQLFSTMAAVSFIALVMVVVVRLIVHDSLRSAAVVFVFLLAFFSYARVIDVRDPSTHGLDDVLIRHRYLLPIYLGGMGIGWWLILRRSGKWLSGLHFVTVTLAILMAFNLGTFIIHRISLSTSNVAMSLNRGAGTNANLPDIYYVIPDMYNRVDVLSQIWDFDNSMFEESLKTKGFIIASDSKSNYSWTHESIASSMSMNYLQPDADWVKLLRNSELLQLARETGYKTIVIDSSYDITDHLKESADLFVEFKTSAFVSGFTVALINSTPLKWSFPGVSDIIDINPLLIENAVAAFNFGTDKVAEIPNIDSPTFTVLYRRPPHPPYIFDRDGSTMVATGPLEVKSTKDQAHTRKYVNQLTHVNRAILENVDAILDNSEIEPIIVIQADHGTDSTCPCSNGNLSSENIFERISIFNAYHVPDSCATQLYPSITPVNSFRFIFSNCLDQDLNLLDDVSYYHDEPPYDFEQVHP